MNAEEIIKLHAPDWNNWHEQCRKQVLAAMEEYAGESRKAFAQGAIDIIKGEVPNDYCDCISVSVGFDFDDDEEELCNICGKKEKP